MIDHKAFIVKNVRVTGYRRRVEKAIESAITQAMEWTYDDISVNAFRKLGYSTKTGGASKYAMKKPRRKYPTGRVSTSEFGLHRTNRKWTLSNALRFGPAGKGDRRAPYIQHEGGTAKAKVYRDSRVVKSDGKYRRAARQRVYKNTDAWVGDKPWNIRRSGFVFVKKGEPRQKYLKFYKSTVVIPTRPWFEVAVAAETKTRRFDSRVKRALRKTFKSAKLPPRLIPDLKEGFKLR